MAENADAGQASQDIRIGLIGGSGLGQLLAAQAEGHAARGRHALRPAERRDRRNPLGRPAGLLPVAPRARATCSTPRRCRTGRTCSRSSKLGVTHVIASGAVGSLRDEFRPRDLVIPDQVIDKTHKRREHVLRESRRPRRVCGTFLPGAASDPVGGEARRSRARGFRRRKADAPDLRPPRVHDRGCYVCMEGPAFSTRAESLMHRLWGGDLIGMTAMPEAKLAREAEMSYALVALVTDYDCWRRPGGTLGVGSLDAANRRTLSRSAGPGRAAEGDHCEPAGGVGQWDPPDPPGRRADRRAPDDRQALLNPPPCRRCSWRSGRTSPGSTGSTWNDSAPLWMKYFE